MLDASQEVKKCLHEKREVFCNLFSIKDLSEIILPSGKS